jgi:hypothetical protein
MEHTEIGFGATGLTITRTLRCAAEIAHDIAEREYMCLMDNLTDIAGR